MFLEELKKQIPEEYFFYSNSIFNLFDLEKINDFYLFLKENNEIGGFFSKADSERIATRHIYESMVYIYYLKEHVNVSRETSILDVGSGPGIPGYILYCLKENPKVSLLDSSRRRLQFIEKYIKQKNYSDIQIIYERIEEWTQQYDVVITRALIPFPYNSVLLKHSFINIAAIFSGNIQINENIIQYLKKHNLIIKNNIKIQELEFLGERYLILLSHIDRTKKLKPIKWKTLRREMDELHNSNS